jgi:hypothetical protein
MRKLMALVIGIGLAVPSTIGWATPAFAESTSRQVAYGAGSALGTLTYAPVKGAFCILGGVSSGFAFVVGGSSAARKVVGTTCRGTWVISPDNLKGREPVRFVGR